MNKVEIKPLSVNEAWQGRRFKTKKYKAYENELLWILPKMEIPEGNLALDLEIGFSNKLSDWDNPIKPFVDILQKKYGFNDSRVYKATVEKVVVPKGKEYIKFSLKAYDQRASTPESCGKVC